MLLSRADLHLPRTIAPTSLTGFYSTCKFFAPPLFHDDKSPPLIQYLFDPRGHIYDLTCRDHLIVTVNVAIEHLFIPEAVFHLTVIIQIFDIMAMCYVAFTSEGGERTGIRVHGGENNPCIVDFALDISGPIVPINSERIDWQAMVILRMKKFHDSGQIIRLTGRLANEIHMV